MKLKRVEFRNFKLLDGVVIEFSTDSQQPLTVVRAENGSGKTSLLWGLAWAFYGDDGLPGKNARLSSTSRPTGGTTNVQVIVDFEHDPDGFGDINHYVLSRSVDEVAGEGDHVDHGPMSTQLMIRKAAGDEPVPGDASAILERFVPSRLKDTFLTDGDRVQRFISGSVAAKERQHNVHQAIKALLGLDGLETVEADISNVASDFRKEMAANSGDAVKVANDALNDCENNLETERTKRLDTETKRSKIEEIIADTEKELSEMTGHGDLDQINADIATAGDAKKTAERAAANLHDEIRALFKSSEDLSWAFAGEALRKGHAVLDGLREQGIIPGSSIGVIKDRLEMGECICGESLAEGDGHRDHVLALLDEQAKISEQRERLTETYHRTRAGLDVFETTTEDERDFWTQRPLILGRHTEVNERIRDNDRKVTEGEERRKGIREDDIQRLTNRLTTNRRHLTEASETIGGHDHEIGRLEDQQALLESRYDKAQNAAKSDATSKNRFDISDDLRKVVEATLHTLKTDHVAAVSTRMNEIFMQIVGSDPEMVGAVFKKVYLTDSFDIVVEAVVDDESQTRTLDTDYEVNGASQRALTLAFIWGLMEVANTVAPRVIDTPLGMTAGGVKRRMVEAITEPAADDGLDYQVVLLLTRSEIRDIEEILDVRAGKHVTLTCSKDYPTDLVHSWEVIEPTVRHCACSHRQFCDTCERQTDGDHNLVKRITND